MEECRKNCTSEIQARKEQQRRRSGKTGVGGFASIWKEVHLRFARTPGHGHCSGGGMPGRQVRRCLPHDDRSLVVGSTVVCSCAVKGRESA